MAIECITSLSLPSGGLPAALTTRLLYFYLPPSVISYVYNQRPRLDIWSFVFVLCLARITQLRLRLGDNQSYHRSMDCVVRAQATPRQPYLDSLLGYHFQAREPAQRSVCYLYGKSAAACRYCAL